MSKKHITVFLLFHHTKCVFPKISKCIKTHIKHILLDGKTTLSCVSCVLEKSMKGIIITKMCFLMYPGDIFWPVVGESLDFRSDNVNLLIDWDPGG